MDKALEHLIKRHGAERFSAELGPAAQRSIRILNRTLAGEPEFGRSRFGGLPDLPEGWVWPHLYGRTLGFLAQINLAEAAPFDLDGLLPPTGMLYFFADLDRPFGFRPDDRERWLVLYAESPPGSGPTPPSHTLPEGWLLRPSSISFVAQWTLPPHESPLLWSLHLTAEESQTYRNAWESGPIHRLLGHPEQFENYLPHDVATAEAGLYEGCWATPEVEAVMAGAEEWSLLLQLDSDWDTNGMMWGDGGRLYFYIRKADLVERRFDRTWLIMQR